ncbi:MAG: hypothetical protein WKF49_04220, partial [Thermoleophilaceae bacterium]
MPLIALVFLALCVAAPLVAQAQRPGQGGGGDVPAATRFCGPGGDPSAPGNGVDPRGVIPSSPN